MMPVSTEYMKGLVKCEEMYHRTKSLSTLESMYIAYCDLGVTHEGIEVTNDYLEGFDNGIKVFTKREEDENEKQP